MNSEIKENPPRKKFPFIGKHKHHPVMLYMLTGPTTGIVLVDHGGWFIGDIDKECDADSFDLFDGTVTLSND